MRVKSTGLGKTEMIAEVEKLKRAGDYLVIQLKSTEPMRWHIRICMSYKDLLGIIRSALTPSTIAFLLLGFRSYKNPKPPPEY